MDENKQPGLTIAQVVLLRASFAHRADAFTLPPRTSIGDLQVQIELAINGKKGEPAVVVRLRAFTPKDLEPKPLYSFDVEVAALVHPTPGEENLEPLEWAKGMGAATLYPFLREALANITLKGRFGAVWLKPFNFPALNASTQAKDAASP